MAIFIVSYEFESPEQTFPFLYDKLKKYPRMKISESTYIIEANKSPEELWEEVMESIDENDSLLIFKINEKWSGYHKDYVLDWLEERLS